MDDVRALVDAEPLSRESAETLRGHLVASQEVLAIEAAVEDDGKPWVVRRAGAEDARFPTEREAVAYIQLAFEVAARKLPFLELHRDGAPVARCTARLATRRELVA